MLLACFEPSWLQSAKFSFQVGRDPSKRCGNICPVRLRAARVQPVGILETFIGGRADLTGNGVPDAVFVGSNGCTIRLFLNDNGTMSAPGLPMPGEKHNTLYGFYEIL